MNLLNPSNPMYWALAQSVTQDDGGARHGYSTSDTVGLILLASFLALVALIVWWNTRKRP